VGRYYVLKDNQVIEEPDHAKWVAWRETSFAQVHTVAQTGTKFGTVVTTFLGMNMTLAKNAPPQLFETRVTGGWLNNEWERFATLAEAQAGHEAWVARVHEMEAEHELPPPGCQVW
jgi:hypothetical protein